MEGAACCPCRIYERAPTLSQSPATNYNVARLVWKQASTSHDMKKAEEYLRATIKYAEEDGDEEAEFLWDNGMELLHACYAKVETAVGRRHLQYSRTYDTNMFFSRT